MAVTFRNDGVSKETKSILIKKERDRLLEATDWTQALDVPLSPKCFEEFTTYRQALRDVEKQKTFPYSVKWPTLPKVEWSTDPNSPPSKKMTILEEENKLLKERVAALGDQNDFQEDCLVEMANIVYA